jgi:pyruvate dehydrogenase E1 component alpha subunit
MLRRTALAISQSAQRQSAFRARAFSSQSAEFEFTPFVSHNCEPPSNKTTATKDEMMGYYKTMYTMRRMEIAADIMYKGQQIRGFCHLYDGQEAVCVGMEAALDGGGDGSNNGAVGDCLVTGYRDHCQQIARGDSVKRVLLELAGKATGSTKGKGGSMHLYAKDRNFFGGHGIVGSTGPLGTGLAFAIKYEGQDRVAVACYGDGAANQGQIYEAMNMAVLWKLPIIYVCENNRYGMGTTTARAAMNENFHQRGDVIPGMKVDGMDVLAVREATRYAADNFCRVGKGPFILEMDTYRYHGHSMSDPGTTYRSRDEISGVRKERDPVDRVKKIILEQGWATAEELKAMDMEVRKEIDEAVKQCATDPEPAVSELYTEMFSGEQPKYVRGTELLNGVGAPY